MNNDSKKTVMSYQMSIGGKYYFLSGVPSGGLYTSVTEILYNIITVYISFMQISVILSLRV